MNKQTSHTPDNSLSAVVIYTQEQSTEELSAVRLKGNATEKMRGLKLLLNMAYRNGQNAGEEVLVEDPETAQERDRLKAANIEAEAAIGENLHWLADQLDQQIRQKDAETIKRLAQLNAAWVALVKAGAK